MPNRWPDTFAGEAGQAAAYLRPAWDREQARIAQLALSAQRLGPSWPKRR